MREGGEKKDLSEIRRGEKRKGKKRDNSPP